VTGGSVRSVPVRTFFKDRRLTAGLRAPVTEALREPVLRPEPARGRFGPLVPAGRKTCLPAGRFVATGVRCVERILGTGHQPRQGRQKPGHTACRPIRGSFAVCPGLPAAHAAGYNSSSPPGPRSGALSPDGA
jgi:hypothetical protein